MKTKILIFKPIAYRKKFLALRFDGSLDPLLYTSNNLEILTIRNSNTLY